MHRYWLSVWVGPDSRSDPLPDHVQTWVSGTREADGWESMVILIDTTDEPEKAQAFVESLWIDTEVRFEPVEQSLDWVPTGGRFPGAQPYVEEAV